MTTLSDTTVAVLYLLALSLLTGLSMFSARGRVASENLLVKIASKLNRVGCGLLWLGSAMLFVGYFAQSVEGGREFFVGMARWGTRLAIVASVLVIIGSVAYLTLRHNIRSLLAQRSAVMRTSKYSTPIQTAWRLFIRINRFLLTGATNLARGWLGIILSNRNDDNYEESNISYSQYWRKVDNFSDHEIPGIKDNDY